MAALITGMHQLPQTHTKQGEIWMHTFSRYKAKK